MVEPAFLVLGKPKAHDIPLRVLIADTESSGKALRAMRRKHLRTTEDSSGYFLDPNGDRSWVTPTSWVPRTFQYGRLLKSLMDSTPRVASLFSIEQGTLTGRNKSFILSKDAFEKLDISERAWFRPVAGSSTIRNCAIHREKYVFYPYDNRGKLRLNTEKEVELAIPKFFSEKIKPHKDELSQRRDRKVTWWALNWPRPFQSGARRKICSAHFGDVGSFAYDDTGEYIVVQGFAWIRLQRDEEFSKGNLPWAYLAILNSTVFETLLSCFCPRVQGGQFDLSKRHVENAFIPDLLDGVVPGELIDALENSGRRMAAGDNEYDAEELDELVMRAYGVSRELWRLPTRATKTS
jgi:hypothetical protein